MERYYIDQHWRTARAGCAKHYARSAASPNEHERPLSSHAGLVLGTAWNSTYRALCTRATGKSKNDSLLFVFYSGFYCLLVFTLEHTVKLW
jgi:hypothetical protein